MEERHRPHSLDIDVTTYCNLKCTMCFREGLKGLPRKHMSFKTFKKALYEAKPTQSVVFVGLGEPLLNPDFYDMLKEVKKQRLFCNMVTNGTLLDEEWAERLIKLGVDKISISMDGATKQTYESIRRGASFDKVIANIKYLTRLRDNNFMNNQLPFIRLDMVAMRQNIHELPSLVRLAKEVGAQGVQLLNMQPLTEEISKQHLHTMPNSEVFKYYTEAGEESLKHKIQLQLRPLEPKPVPCYSPWSNPYIDVDGNVCACCLPGSEKIRGTEYYMGTRVEFDPKKLQFGNVNKQSFEKIWLGKKYYNLRKFLNSFMVEDTKQEWTREKYLELRRKNSKPKNYCVTCGRRFQVVC